MSDEQRELIRKHFPEEHCLDDRPGRKPIPAGKVLEAGLWILNTSAQWHLLPQSYPNYKAVHRHFQQWCENEVIHAALTDLANALRDEGAIDESECYIDATFASAKGGGEQIGPTRRGEGVKIMATVTGRATLAPLQASLDRRAILCLDSVATSTLGPLGVPPSQLPRLRAACSPLHPAQAV